MILPQNTFEKFNYLPSSLSNGSNKKVCIQCDYCLATFDKTYFHYNSSRKSSTIQKDACSTCKSKKQHEAIKVSGRMELIQAKRSATNIQKYGHVTPAHNTTIQEKTKKANLKKYGVEHHIQSKEVKEKIKNTVQERCKNSPIFYVNIPTNEEKVDIKKSLVEIADFLRSIGMADIETSNRKVIAPKELDIYIPSKNLAIEFCGLYWHSDIFIDDPGYHQSKMEACNAVGVRLITIFEDEWNNQQQICQARLKSACGIGDKEMARKCTIVKNPLDRDSFLDLHHIQGSCRGVTASYSLVDPSGTTIAMMTFGKPRFSRKHEAELLRYVSTKSITGGAKKLFAAFATDHNPSSVLSYCDLRWGTGGVYESLGFKQIASSKPAYHYAKEGVRYNRMSFSKKRLVEKHGGDPTMSEKSIMESMDFARIYDCGNAVYVWNR